MDKHDKCVNVALCIKNLMQDIEAFKKERTDWKPEERVWKGMKMA